MADEYVLAARVAELDPELRQLTEELIAIPSVGGSTAELEIQALVAHRLADFGLTVAQSTTQVADLASVSDFPGMEVPRSEVVNVTGTISGVGTSPGLLLLGHSDVVPPGAAMTNPFHPRWSGNRLYGRGTVDMKAGLAAAIIAATAVQQSGTILERDVVVASVSGEEDGGVGTFALLRSGLLPELDAAIIPEPTDLVPVSANAGSLTFEIVLTGHAAHGAMRWQGHNATELLAPVLAALRQLETQRCAQAGAEFADWPLAFPISIGTIHGGSWASTVADEIRLTGRYGVQLGESLAAAKDSFARALATAAAKDPWLREHPPVVTWWGAEFAPAATIPSAPILSALQSAGVGARPIAAPYGSDLRQLVNLAQLGTVQLGPGRPVDAHTDSESVWWPDVQRCAAMLAATIVAYCGSPVDNPGVPSEG